MKKYKLTPLARIVAYADAELDPMDFCIAPAKSSAKALSRAGYFLLFYITLDSNWLILIIMKLMKLLQLLSWPI
mgnify:CR=1 FL=1